MRWLGQEAVGSGAALGNRQGRQVAQQLVQQLPAPPAAVVRGQRAVGARRPSGLVGQRLGGGKRRRRIGFVRRGSARPGFEPGGRLERQRLLLGGHDAALVDQL